MYHKDGIVPHPGGYFQGPWSNELITVVDISKITRKTFFLCSLFAIHFASRS